MPREHLDQISSIKSVQVATKRSKKRLLDNKIIKIVQVEDTRKIIISKEEDLKVDQESTVISLETKEQKTNINIGSELCLFCKFEVCFKILNSHISFL